METKSRARETEGEEVRRQVCGREERRAVGAGSALVCEKRADSLSFSSDQAFGNRCRELLAQS